MFLELCAAPNQIAFRNLREKHLPLVQKEFTEKHLPNAVIAGKAAGAHLTRALTFAGEHFQKGYTAAGEHIKNGYTATSSAVRNHVRLHFPFPFSIFFEARAVLSFSAAVAARLAKSLLTFCDALPPHSGEACDRCGQHTRGSQLAHVDSQSVVQHLYFCPRIRVLYHGSSCGRSASEKRASGCLTPDCSSLDLATIHLCLLAPEQYCSGKVLKARAHCGYTSLRLFKK